MDRFVGHSKLCPLIGIGLGNAWQMQRCLLHAARHNRWEPDFSFFFLFFEEVNDSHV